MKDMTPADVVGEGRRVTLNFHDGSSRIIYVTDRETLFPRGELIVSQTDVDGIITMCNDAFVRMSGYSREELLGSPHAILRHPDMPAAAFADLWDTVSQGRRWHGYVKNHRKDGGFYWVHAVVIPKVRNGQIVGHTSVRREPSRAKIAEAEAAYAALRGRRGLSE